MSCKLTKKYRPVKIEEVWGQAEVVQIVMDWEATNSIPDAILLIGPSGVGKTTIARILAKSLKCSDSDYEEVNCAHMRGIDEIREIARNANYKPMAGPVRVWFLDEFDKLTNAAQNCCLKMLEEPPKHAYFFLASSEPNKIIKAIKTRCSPLTLKSIDDTTLLDFLTNICEQEKFKAMKEKVWNKLIACAEGSARMALVLLDKIQRLETSEQQLRALDEADQKKEAIEIARALIYKKITWKELAEIVKNITDDPEKVRHLVLSYATTILLNGKNDKAKAIIDYFRDPWYDCGGRTGLISCCYEVYHS